jgi:CheY-like chemotaxis protein
LKKAGEEQQIRRTVLVVDAEEIVQKTIGSILQCLGYRVLAAADAGHANALFTKHGLELALLVVDIRLATVSGPEFVDRLPTLETRVPVLFTTAGGEFEANTVRRSFPVLKKPFRADTLLATIKTLVPGA